jgi:hypothetical protein
VTSNNVAWAPGPGPAAAPGGWPPPARPGPDPATLLRVVGGALAVAAGALIAGGTFPALMILRREGGDSTTTSRLSGWGWSSELEPETPGGRELLFGIPLALVATLLLVAGALVLLSVRRPDRRPRALTATVGAVAAATAVFWVVSSNVADWVRLYEEIDLEGWAVSRASGYWLALAGTMLALLALVGVLVAALLESPRRRRAPAATTPQGPYAPGPYAAQGPWAPPPAAPQAWPAAGPPYGGPAPFTWGETR